MYHDLYVVNRTKIFMVNNGALHCGVFYPHLLPLPGPQMRDSESECPLLGVRSPECFLFHLLFFLQMVLMGLQFRYLKRFCNFFCTIYFG